MQTLSGRLQKGTLRTRLIKAATGTFGLKVASTGLSMVVSMLLARLLGVAGYGAYSYAMAWIGLLLVPAIFGLDQLLVRDLATYQTKQFWALMGGLLRWSTRMVLAISIGLALLAAGLTQLFAEHVDMQMLGALRIALCALPLLCLMGLKEATMHGLQHVVMGRLPETIIRPLSLLLLIGGAFLILGERLNANWAVGLNAVAVGIALIMGTYLVHNTLPQPVRHVPPVYQTRIWMGSALPLMFIHGINMINNRTDILMLGAMKSAEAVGVYNVASRGAQLIIFIQIAVNAALGPTIASLYVTGNMQLLQRVITKSARLVFLVSLSMASGLVLFGDWFLALFGADFTRGHGVLTILSVGWLVNALAGAVGLLLVMTGYERDTAVVTGMSAMLNIILNTVLIPRFGAEGAAASTAISMTTWNLILIPWVYRRIGIHSTALGRGVRLWRGKR